MTSALSFAGFWPLVTAGASWRRPTRFNAPRGSPAASARAAAAISESILHRSASREGGSV
jgi:hypothetical protein